MGTKALAALTSALGKDPRTFTDLMVSTRAIASASATAASPALRGGVDLIIEADEFNGYTQDTEQGSENVISTSVPKATSTTTSVSPGFYYDENGTRVEVSENHSIITLKGKDPNDPKDIGSIV